jgi:tetratricopeptide (TPR) repeat protein
LPLVGLAVAASVATVVLQQRVGATAGLDALPWSVRLANAVVACVRYLGHAVWPVDLAAFYPYPQSFPAPVVMGAAALLVAITVGALTQRRSRPYLLVGWLWFVVTLSPVLGFLQAGEQAMADRFMYVPLVGLSVAIAWAARELREARPALRRPIEAAAAVAVLVCAVVAYPLTSSWHDSLTLWTRAAAVTSGNYMAEEKLGEALRDRGDSAGALAHYTRALDLAPASDKYQAVVRNDLGLVLMEEGRVEEALAEFKEASRRDPSFAEARTNLGNSLAAAGRPAEAIPHYEAALVLDPSAASAQVGLGSALLGQGRAADAQPHFAAALQIDPSLAQAHNGLGSSLAMQDRLDDALAQYREAIRLKPDLPTAHFNVSVVLIKQGRTDEARRELEAALAIDPSYAQARRVLDAIKPPREP